MTKYLRGAKFLAMSVDVLVFPYTLDACVVPSCDTGPTNDWYERMRATGNWGDSTLNNNHT